MPVDRELFLVGTFERSATNGESALSIRNAGSIGGELLTALGFSEELSELLGIRVDVVTPRTMRTPVRELALAEAVPL
jgi:predicted nucleotidyltransferase